ncbi:MAG: hypothetical protein NTZ05_09995, partial [Chloroflexi bacterium]|nr:hypothetical protein [Chloroflexota bacterium]
KPGGHLSLAFQDRRGAPHEALRRGDAAGALALARGEVADPPGLLAEDVAVWLAEAGFQPVRAGVVDAALSAPPLPELGAEIAEALRQFAGDEPPARLRHIVARRPAVFPIPL